jgi:hypothetical protein
MFDFLKRASLAVLGLAALALRLWASYTFPHLSPSYSETDTFAFPPLLFFAFPWLFSALVNVMMLAY